MKNIYFVLLALVILSCKQNIEPEVKTAPSYSEGNVTAITSGDLNHTTSTTAVTFKTEEASQIHEAYLELKAALVNTDATDAAEVAQEFQQMLGTVAESNSITKLKTDLELIAKSNEVKQQRVAFENVSIHVEKYLSETIKSGTLIKQYCPMAFEGKGAYWLSDSKEIRNPYYGDKMLKCGVVDKKIE